MVVDSYEEEGTALIRQKRNMGKTSGTSQVQVALVVDKSDKNGVATKGIEAENQSLAKDKEKAVEVIETSVDDKARIGESVLEILELVAPKKLMNFELKWSTEVLDLKQALPEVEEEETPVGVVNTVVLGKSPTVAINNTRKYFCRDGIDKEVEGCAQLGRIQSIDMLHHANPVFKYVSDPQNLTTLESRVMKIKLVPNKLVMPSGRILI
ncbi:hypothetical protein TSUD_207430 [Trifolium subterraneum]|uniref:Uncharacterized protein n=1 Tax=Trifolium subterraneum TaxID=3900 RepID=A0A2Z6P3T5_TRISU|nr:hypothetical protein TSUD_207430 [Trifolium subterraneum]